MKNHNHAEFFNGLRDRYEIVIIISINYYWNEII